MEKKRSRQIAEILAAMKNLMAEFAELKTEFVELKATMEKPATRSRAKK
jgi:allophanate hydrolase subunit 1